MDFGTDTAQKLRTQLVGTGWHCLYRLVDQALKGSSVEVQRVPPSSRIW